MHHGVKAPTGHVELCLLPCIQFNSPYAEQRGKRCHPSSQGPYHLVGKTNQSWSSLHITLWCCAIMENEGEKSSAQVLWEQRGESRWVQLTSIATAVETSRMKPKLLSIPLTSSPRTFPQVDLLLQTHTIAFYFASPSVNILWTPQHPSKPNSCIYLCVCFTHVHFMTGETVSCPYLCLFHHCIPYHA